MDTNIPLILICTIAPPVLGAMYFAVNGRRINREWRERTTAKRAARGRGALP